MAKSSETDGTMGEYERNAYRRLIQHVIRVNKVAADPFLHPVPRTVIGYYDIIKNPMDLTTIRHKIDNHTYKSRGELESDFLLMISNAYIFNHPKHKVCEFARELEMTFMDLMVAAIHDINKELAIQRQTQIDNEREARKLKRQMAKRQAALLERRKNIRDGDDPQDIGRKLELLEKTMAKKKNVLDGKPAAAKLSEKQRAQLTSDLEQIDERHIAGLRAILEGEPGAVFGDDGELELDLEGLSAGKQRDLFKYMERLKMSNALHKQLSRET